GASHVSTMTQRVRGAFTLFGKQPRKRRLHKRLMSNDASRNVMKETDVNRRLRSEPTTRLTHIKIERTWHSGIQSPEDTHTQPTQGFTIRLMWTKSIRNCL